jgi:phenylacetate-coenzyme A ligase PaaK-like adenylate-forming protein
VQRPWIDPSPAATQRFLAAVPRYADDDDPTFWEPDRLAAERSRLLTRQLGWNAEASAHYQKAGIGPGLISDVRDLAKLPVTTKAELMADPASFRLRFETPTLYDMTYTTVYTTGTTTGRPTPYEYTTHDWLAVLHASRHGFACLGVVPGDVWLHGFPLSPIPHIAGFAAHLPGTVGATYVHGMTGMAHPEFPVHRPVSALAEMVEELRPQVLSGVGSFLRRMFADAAAAGRDFSSLKIIAASGETLTDKMRQHMHEQLVELGAAEIFIASPYGFTEGGLQFGSCYEGGPLHNTAPDQIILEVVDRETSLPVEDGVVGAVAITHLNRRGMPLVRYLLGDLGAMTHETCSMCGRTAESMLVSAGSAHVVRSSELLKIKGTLVNPQVIHNVVMDAPAVLEYQLIVRHAVEGDPMSEDQLLLRVAARTGSEIDVDGLRQAVRNATEVTPKVDLLADPSEIYNPTSDFKARRLIDERMPVQ